MKKTIGVLAHVDAGKTTFSEQVLYHTNSIRSRGRVDHKDAFLDSHSIERKRGITVFSDQAVFEFNDSTYYLIDTPGHVDFSTEMERSIGIMDYAIIIISAVEGVQGHTKTVWRLLEKYKISTFFFINKLDRVGADKDKVIEEIKKNLTKDICYIDKSSIKFKADKEFNYESKDNSNTQNVQNNYLDLNDEIIEFISEYDEVLLEKYLEGEYDEKLWKNVFRNLIKENKVFPCFAGSALQDEGILEFIYGLDELTFTNYEDLNVEDCNDNSSLMPMFRDNILNTTNKFAGYVYKVRHEATGNRITFIKCLKGELKVRDEIIYGGEIKANNSSSEMGKSDNSKLQLSFEYENEIKEKVSSIRIYNGNKFKVVDNVKAGEVFGVTGLTNVLAGEGIGELRLKTNYEMVPTLMSKVIFDASYNIKEVLGYFKLLEAEDPALNVIWSEAIKEMHVHIMGKIQLEVLKEIVEERFNLSVEFGPCEILYKESILETAIGSGHFEPLRHYAEVHLKIEPLPRNSGIIFENKCHSDHLTIGNQNLIKTHIFEREHHGILTGSPLTDIKITLLTGRAHLKHTSGGDFREATFRALRQGLEKVKNILLEPYYKFTIEVEQDFIGRVLSDIQKMDGTFDPPEIAKDKMIVNGRGPVATFMDYPMEVIAFTKGKGHINLIYDGYDNCHNSEEVIQKRAYNKNADIEYTSSSIFCSHGQGYIVEWDEADKSMHCELE
ncbi:elongation factor G [Clostridium saccharobutylicum]|uniref:Elongation factor G n=1 Tax=Clostridium saccharobutylicum TaxID=169679 RepID=A0A1S8NC27_CLOSA|nr:TetM/TetW/TetO/TetS family tetracycline resistance ribosomal protection protein [Clostridium saccharobutylicum]OOM13831.1 elongation factor G [Clostridium saccharobutylicum]